MRLSHGTLACQLPGNLSQVPLNHDAVPWGKLWLVQLVPVRQEVPQLHVGGHEAPALREPAVALLAGVCWGLEGQRVGQPWELDGTDVGVVVAGVLAVAAGPRVGGRWNQLHVAPEHPSAGWGTTPPLLLLGTSALLPGPVSGCQEPLLPLCLEGLSWKAQLIPVPVAIVVLLIVLVAPVGTWVLTVVLVPPTVGSSRAVGVGGAVVVAV